MSNEPEYLKTFKKSESAAVPDNFDHTDLVWTGASSFDDSASTADDDEHTVDPDALMAHHGWDFRSPLQQVLTALVAGNRPTLDAHEQQTLVREIENKLLGSAKRGPPEKDDSALLLEVASRYHAAFVEGQGALPALLPICEKVVEEYRKDLGREGSDENLPKTLVRKFEKHRDLWLARSTTGDGYYAPERMNQIHKLVAGLTLLQETGVGLDLSRISPSKRAETLTKRVSE